jgi:glutaredoxin-related protein
MSIANYIKNKNFVVFSEKDNQMVHKISFSLKKIHFTEEIHFFFLNDIEKKEWIDYHGCETFPQIYLHHIYLGDYFMFSSYLEDNTLEKILQ